MDIESFREYCLRRAGTVTESEPFGEGALVFKVEGKMFALAALNEAPPSVNLKCDPEEALALRERYDAVRPGYHMNKRLWNTVVLDGSVPDREVRAMIDASHALVVAGLPKKVRDKILAKK